MPGEGFQAKQTQIEKRWNVKGTALSETRKKRWLKKAR